MTSQVVNNLMTCDVINYFFVRPNGQSLKLDY